MRLLPIRGGKGTRLRRVATAAAALLLSTGMVAIVATQARAAAGCTVTPAPNPWPTGFTIEFGITNLGDPLTSWRLEFDWPGNQVATPPGWNGTVTQASGSRHVTVVNAAWNGTLGTGATTTSRPGFQGTLSGTQAFPTAFTLNGVACTGQVGGSQTASPPRSNSASPSRSNSASPSRSNSASPSRSNGPSPSVSGPPGPGRVDNPYVGARGYVNPEWKAKAESVSGGNRVSNNPTGVWLDRIAAINGTPNSSSNGSMGVRDHLNAALTQGAGYIQFVIYDLPGRDCAALASNGELGPNDLPRYKAEYIDPIAAIFADPAFRNIRIVTIIEIDSLPNLITNVSGAAGTPQCQAMQQNGGYVQGIGYALSKFGPIPNVYNYIDAAHHGWIGWDTNFNPTADLMLQAARASGSQASFVTGFITNTANYSALREPFFTINDTVGGQSVRNSTWVDFNFYVDELSFAQAFRQRLVSIGFPSNIGMLIDTSRNGWGGSARPTGPGPTTNVNTYVNGGRIDRRIHAGNWCNQAGAGLGERPQAAPASGIDAYVWIKPPGESDGSSVEIPNNEGKGFDRMCDPTYGGNARNGNSMTGALSGAPISGAFFPAQFTQLMQNAFPAL